MVTHSYLGAVPQRDARVGRHKRRCVSRDRGLDLCLARSDHSRVEVNLWREAQRLLERLQEADARNDVAHLHPGGEKWRR